jgi:hypothetical protein
MHVSLCPRFNILSPCLTAILSPSTTNAFHHLFNLSLPVGRACSLISLVSLPYLISRMTTSLVLKTDGVGYDVLERISTARE